MIGYNQILGAMNAEYETDMEKCLAYIDLHLSDHLTPKDIANWMGYSFYHFCHVFSICNEIPIGEYLRKRRLAKAANALCAGNRITDIALSFGFETPSGFARAFKKEFGMSASEYRIKRVKERIEPKLIELQNLKAVGYRIPPKEGKEFHPYENAAHWFGADFSSVTKEEYKKLAGDNKGEIGLWYHPEEISGSMTYFFGPVVNSFDFIPPTMIPLEISASTYAVFTTETVDVSCGIEVFQVAIKNAWKYIYGEWFKKSEYQCDEEKLAFEYYYDETGISSGYATADIYVPVLKR